MMDNLSLKDQYRLIGSHFPIQQQLDALHSLTKELKAINRARINSVVNGRGRVDIDRPDIQLLKNGR